MKKSLVAIMAMAGVILSTSSFANPICDGSLQNPCVVVDTKENTAKIKKFRSAPMLAKAYKGNTHGLKHLMVSVSAVPTEAAFKNIIREVEKATHGRYKRIIDVDLRQESHAYLNGDSITLMSDGNWVNRGKSHDEAVTDEQRWQYELSTHSTIPNVLTGTQFKDKAFDQGKEIKVKSLALESTVVENLGMEYRRLTVSDHLGPEDSEVDSFVNLVSSVMDNEWLHIHCRGGDGRSTTFFAMIDMLENANKVSFNDIIRRQASVEPFYDLSHIQRKDPEMSKYYRERFKFLEHFYQYASARMNGYSGTWSQWRKDNWVK